MSAYDNDHVTTGTIEVPMDAALENVRMRVRSQFFTTPEPCGDAIGEVEDYTIAVLAASGVEDAEAGSPFKVFPNPNDGSFEIETNGIDVEEIRLLDLSGRTIFVQDGTSLRVNVDGLSSGMYLLECIWQGQSHQTKLMIE